MSHEPASPRPIGRPATAATAKVRAARDLLFAHADEYEGAVAAFAWPDLDEFNFALEWFDVVAREHPERVAVTIVDADLVARFWTYGELSRRSDQVAAWFTELGLRRGDRVIVMLGNQIELWETMLALLSRADLVPCDGDENVGGVRAGRGGRGDLVAADADGDVAERAQGPDDLADAVAGGLLQVA